MIRCALHETLSWPDVTCNFWHITLDLGLWLLSFPGLKESICGINIRLKCLIKFPKSSIIFIPTRKFRLDLCHFWRFCYVSQVNHRSPRNLIRLYKVLHKKEICKIISRKIIIFFKHAFEIFIKMDFWVRKMFLSLKVLSHEGTGVGVAPETTVSLHLSLWHRA